jgi:hypothetical protein
MNRDIKDIYVGRLKKIDAFVYLMAVLAINLRSKSKIRYLNE